MRLHRRQASVSTVPQQRCPAAGDASPMYMQRRVVARESRSIKSQNYQAAYSFFRLALGKAASFFRERARDPPDLRGPRARALREPLTPEKSASVRRRQTPDGLFRFFNNTSSMHTHALHGTRYTITRPHTHLDTRGRGPRARGTGAHRRSAHAGPTHIYILCTHARVRRNEAPLRTCGGGAFPARRL